MFISKIKERKSGILVYGITPPKATTLPEKVGEIAAKTLDYLCPLDIDALVVYDVQDESARTADERPFPYSDALDPFDYASKHLQRLTVPKIIYRPAGKFTKEELTDWLADLKSNGFYPVFVGLPTPDYVVKTSLQEAYAIWKENHLDHSVIGAVTIPERHAALKDEDKRILDKASCGVSYFITQCIFNVGYTKETLESLLATCQATKQPVPTVIFTLTVCGSLKTLHFMEWLGIHIPDDIKAELEATTTPIAHSVGIATTIAKDLIAYCQEKSIPFGFNIESVAIRKEEINASLELVKTVGELLQASGLRSKKQVVQQLAVE